MNNIDVPDTNQKRIVIVGGGFAGINLAQTLKSSDMQVVLLDRNNYHTFQPLLYQVATAGLEPDSVAYPLRKIFKHYKGFFFRMANVEKILTDEQLVVTSIGELSYDYLVVCSGSETNYFGMTNVEKNSMPLKTITQALDLRSLLLQNFEKALTITENKLRDAHMHFVIVGGGPTGVELAGALAELKAHVLPIDYPELDVRKMEIHLVEAGPRLLPGLHEKSSEKSFKFLKNMGVQIWTNTSVTDYDGTTVKTDKNRTITAKNLIWSAGVKGAIPQGINADLITYGNRLLVNEYNQIGDFDNVFAIGDVACMISEDYPKGHPGVAQVAIQQGKTLGENLLRLEKGKEMKPFSYFDKGSMATVGKNKAVVEVGSIRSQGFFAWFIWMFVHIAFLVGFRNRLVVLINWLWNYINYDRGIRLIIRPFDRGKKMVKTQLEVEELKG
jgi:NADH dehydrogenase